MNSNPGSNVHTQQNLQALMDIIHSAQKERRSPEKASNQSFKRLPKNSNRQPLEDHQLENMPPSQATGNFKIRHDKNSDIPQLLSERQLQNP